MTRGGVIGGLGMGLILVLSAEAAWAWGARGHALVATAAVRSAGSLPRWFRAAEDALADQAGAPDRWRALRERAPALAARDADHFFDLDVWGPERLPGDRWRYVQVAMQRRLSPEEVGFLPWAVVEQYGILVSAFQDVRAGRAGGREAAIAAAGVLAHLVGDAVVPLHATRHHHGWVGRNPSGFTRAPGVHQWFESRIVDGLSVSDATPPEGALEPLGDPQAAIVSALRDALALVAPLYAAEQRSRLDRENGPARALARERLRAGASLLARFWRDAWEGSAR